VKWGAKKTERRALSGKYKMNITITKKINITIKLSLKSGFRCVITR
jgi:hypothetical protein